MRSYQGTTFDEVLFPLLIDLYWDPDHMCAPRGHEVKEILCPTLVILDPRSRLLSNRARDASYAFAVGEFLWYYRGATDLDSIRYYNKRAMQFSDDGKTVNSAYGAIMQGKTEPHVDQWEIAIRTLTNDPDSRRAVVQIHQPIHQRLADECGSSDVPCTLSLQFFVRKDHVGIPGLHMHVNMRSNDVMWGLTYDVFSFTLFQELMMHELMVRSPEKFSDLTLGRYYHTAGSMHLYSHHYGLAEKMLGEYRTKGTSYAQAQAPIDFKDMPKLVGMEAYLRETPGARVEPPGMENPTIRWMFDRLIEQRMKRDEEANRK